MAWFSGPLSFRLQARSASNAMSGTRCSPFSIDQCARTASAKPSGVSRAEERQVGMAVVVTSPIWRVLAPRATEAGPGIRGSSW